MLTNTAIHIRIALMKTTAKGIIDMCNKLIIKDCIFLDLNCMIVRLPIFKLSSKIQWA